jgi:adenylate cyclase
MAKGWGSLMWSRERSKAGQRCASTPSCDGRTGGHIWAERYDGDLSDIFALQDEITLKIVGALKVSFFPKKAKL